MCTTSLRDMKNILCNIDEYILTKSQVVEKRLGELVAIQNVPYQTLLQSARYSLLAGGKRLRPILALATAETLGSHFELALDPACALEMIHTYSLIHDDLPCMDNDDFRRGKPSVHKAFSEGHAVLTGDFLLTFAFEVIANASHLSSQKKVELIGLLAKNSGLDGMIGGQVMDIESEGIPLEIHFLREMHERKTGALISAAIEFGATIANINIEHRSILKHFGRELGLAFQVIDDVLDVTTNKHSDQKNNKSTYVTLLGMENAKKLAYTHCKTALENLEKLPYNTQLLSALADLLVYRNK